jgi:hypothetical protein
MVEVKSLMFVSIRHFRPTFALPQLIEISAVPCCSGDESINGEKSVCVCARTGE